MAKLRAVMLAAVSEDDMRAVVLKLVEMAIGGDLKAIDLLLTRTLGKADSGPLVAVQMNQQADGTGELLDRYAVILARIKAEKAERAARGEVEEPLTPEELERCKAEFRIRIAALRP